MEQVWLDIQEDVQGLVDALNHNLSPPQTEDITFT
jgi:hypothetical protein